MGERKIINNKSTRGISALIIVIIVVIAVVVVGVGVYVATRGNGTSPSTSATPTPALTSTATPKPTSAPRTASTPASTSTATSKPTSTPTTTSTPASTSTATSKPTSTPTTTSTPTSTSTSSIETATSYEFNETGTASNGTVLDKVFYASKNIGTSNVDLLEVVTTPSTGTLEYIVNGAQQKAWVYQGGQWTDLSSEFSTILPTVQSAAGVYTNMLTYYGGSGGYTYTIPSGQPNAGDTATFTNIKINPSLPDSLFQPPS